jgi:hypothetical protein
MSLITLAVVNSILAIAMVAALVNACRVPFRIDRQALDY